jgi:hypothetical protein
MQDFFDVPSRFATEYHHNRPNPTDACSPAAARSAHRRAGQDSGLPNRWCASDEVPSAATVGVTLRRVMRAKS